eukprot:366492-Chlamydomonas_euryale.AAC.11
MHSTPNPHPTPHLYTMPRTPNPTLHRTAICRRPADQDSLVSTPPHKAPTRLTPHRTAPQPTVRVQTKTASVSWLWSAASHLRSRCRARTRCRSCCRWC